MRNSRNEDKGSGAPGSKLAKVSSGNSVPDCNGTEGMAAGWLWWQCRCLVKLISRPSWRNSIYSMATVSYFLVFLLWGQVQISVGGCICNGFLQVQSSGLLPQSKNMHVYASCRLCDQPQENQEQVVLEALSVIYRFWKFYFIIFPVHGDPKIFEDVAISILVLPKLILWEIKPQSLLVSHKTFGLQGK